MLEPLSPFTSELGGWRAREMLPSILSPLEGNSLPIRDADDLASRIGDYRRTRLEEMESARDVESEE
jgi:hypothetical protein